MVSFGKRLLSVQPACLGVLLLLHKLLRVAGLLHVALEIGIHGGQVDRPALGQEAIDDGANDAHPAGDVEGRRLPRGGLDRREDLRPDGGAGFPKAGTDPVAHPAHGGRVALHAHQADGRARSHVAEGLEQAVQHHERGDAVLRQRVVAPADDEAEHDVPAEAEHTGPLPADLVHQPGADQDAGDGEERQDQLPDGDGADGLAGDDGVDDGAAHDGVGEVDEVVEEEGARCAQQAEPVLAQHQHPGHVALLEVGLLEQQAVAHLEPEQDHQEGEEDRHAVHGVERHFQIVIGAQQRGEIHEGADRPAAGGHEGRDQDLDGPALAVEKLVAALQRGGGGGGIFAAHAHAGNATGDGHEPEHAVDAEVLGLEDQHGHEGPDDDQGRGEEHAAFARVAVRGVAQDDDPDHRPDQERVRDARLPCRGVLLGCEEVVEDDIGARGEILLVAVGEVCKSLDKQSEKPVSGTRLGCFLTHPTMVQIVPDLALIDFSSISSSEYVFATTAFSGTGAVAWNSLACMAMVKDSKLELHGRYTKRQE
ncbi:hypothetical protein BP6252_00890 [Coleophoma cylindrospora]|uniref:Uncharacterized protein n=1 Tax=Coleophoma cylindrospora TaxID=1849047 RepID=A0A3D8SSW4_9HELO|nr:hypothetical protein BP6252_00890 [Coleophoma cylindrospora]